jgi:AbrB family looped-hinge helix DNA binding protein
MEKRASRLPVRWGCKISRLHRAARVSAGRIGRYSAIPESVEAGRNRRRPAMLLLELPMATTRLSTKGQITLPKGIRDSRAWGLGTEFTVEETGEGILLRPAAHFPDTNLEEVAGCLRSKRKSKTPEQMRAAIDREVKRRHDRGRY